MKTCLACVLAALVATWPALAGDALQPGRYEVEVGLELPHVENLNMRRTAPICVGADGGRRGLPVLSDNTPLLGCPLSDIRQAGDRLTFAIRCEGSNTASAVAVYTLADDAFRGRITIRMGGKNMTMAETQAGRRVGDCQDAAASGPLEQHDALHPRRP